MENIFSCKEIFWNIQVILTPRIRKLAWHAQERGFPVCQSASMLKWGTWKEPRFLSQPGKKKVFPPSKQTALNLGLPGILKWRSPGEISGWWKEWSYSCVIVWIIPYKSEASYLFLFCIWIDVRPFVLLFPSSSCMTFRITAKEYWYCSSFLMLTQVIKKSQKIKTVSWNPLRFSSGIPMWNLKIFNSRYIKFFNIFCSN